MRKLHLTGASVAAAAFVLLTPTTAFAGTNVPWIWNSDDHDAKARFRHYGEHVDLCKHNNAKVKVQVQTQTSGSRSGTYDGGVDSCKDFNWSFAEGDWVRIKVCEVKTAFPDDCSPWSNYGRA